MTHWPRYEFFTEVNDVFKEDGRSVPVFNDKHLSWSWELAKEMVATSKHLDFPFMAGSGLSVTWRMPSWDLPYGAEVAESLIMGGGWLDGGSFHMIEFTQALLERRAGGETGVLWVDACRDRRPSQRWPRVRLMRVALTRRCSKRACAARVRNSLCPLSYRHSCVAPVIECVPTPRPPQTR